MRWFRTVPWWQWLLVAAALLGAVGGGYVGNKLGNAGYTSSSQVLVTGQANAEQPDSAYSSNQYANQRMTTYAQIALSAQVLNPAAQSLGTDAATLATKITPTVEGDTTVLSIAVKGETPDLARRSAAAVTQSLVNTIGRLEAVPGGTARVVLNVITEPVAPPERSALPVWLFVLGGLVGGAVFGFVVVLLLRWLYPSRFSGPLVLRKSGPEPGPGALSGEQTQRLRPVTPPQPSAEQESNGKRPEGAPAEPGTQ